MKTLVVTAVVGALGVGLATAAAAVTAPPADALVVGEESADCAAPEFDTISAAVAAADAGDTVYVCPGLYEEDVAVTKSLTFLGAQSGVDGRTGRTDETQESVVRSATGAFSIAGGVDDVTVDGFTLSGSGSDTSNGNGIDAFNRGAGHSIVNNVISDNTNGINFNSNGSAPTTIRFNRFVENNRSGDQGGNGVFNTSGPANDTLVSDNLFSGHSSAAFNTIGDAAPNRSTGLVFRDNESVDDSSLAVVNQASGAVIESNVADKAPELTGSGIFLGGNSDGTVVRRNRITGGNGVGISVNTTFGAPSTDVLVELNLVRERSTGIQVSGPHDDTVTVRLNGVFDSLGTAANTGFGIRLADTTDGVVLAKNAVLGSRVFDCRDESTGDGTDGTANMWLLNVGATSSPDGLCLPGILPPGVPGDDDGDDKGGDEDHDGKDDDGKDDDGGKDDPKSDGKDDAPQK